MSAYHVVEQGEHLSGIAKRYGFSDYRAIWLHAENAAFRSKRPNPNVIFPGDRLFIPDREPREEPRPTDQRHRFQVIRPRLMLRLVLEDLYERPVGSAPCELRLDGETLLVTTTAQGRIEQPIGPDARDGSLTVRDSQTPINAIPIPIKIGHLDPVEERSGQLARLNNLGYFAGPAEGKSEAESRAAFQSAVEEFQCEHGLAVDGKCGPNTQAKLRHVHGC